MPPRPLTFTIHCPRRIISGFQAVALSRCPKEAYAILFGKIRRSSARVMDIWYPEDQSRYATSNGTETIFGRRTWISSAYAIAESEGLQVIGDIHSHPTKSKELLADPSPSYTDWMLGRGERWIRAICVVRWNSRSVTERGRFRVAWYPPVSKVRTVLH